MQSSPRCIPVYRKGFGLASMELPLVLSPAIRMRIGSTTKQFTALSYMLLCEDGKASLDDPIGKYLPELHPSARGVTARQLMGNTSGLRDACAIKLDFSGIDTRPVTSQDILNLYRDLHDVNAAPGTAFIYNNGGWVLLGLAIERIAGRSLEEIMRTRIFEPIGMHDTLLRRWDSDFVPNSASTHMTDRSGTFIRGSYGMDFAGAGAIASTVNDMLRWMAHMDAPIVGDGTTWQVMKVPQTLLNGTSSGYGVGLRIGGYRGIDTLYHAGGWTGGNAQMIKVPAAALNVVVILNREDVSAVALAARILDSCLPDLDPMPEMPGGPLKAGVFRSEKSGRVVQLFEQAGQQMTSIDGMDLPIAPGTDGVLRPPETASFKVALSLAADSSSLQLIDYGNTDELSRIEAPQQSDARAIAGVYRSSSAEIEAVLTETPAGPRLRTRTRFGHTDFTLDPLATDIWRARSTGARRHYGGILSFTADHRTFHFSHYLTRSLRFHRA
jgi:D-aminopeptidase